MTRVFSVFFLTFALTLAQDAKVTQVHDVFALLDSYSPDTSNLTLIETLLEARAKQDDPEAFSKLGEFWLLGLPIAPDHLYEDSKFTATQKFVRNYDLAVYYLKKSLSSGTDSSFFIQLLLQQSFLVQGLEKYTPVSGATLATLKSLQEQSLSKMSALGIISTVNQYQMCYNRVYIPEFLRSKSAHHVTAPISSNAFCDYKCEDLAYLALNSATEALKYIQRTNKEIYDIPPVEEKELLTASKLQNILKMFEKQSTAHKVSSYANYYIHGHKIIGMKPELETGLNLLEKSAAHGNVNAHESLGVLYSQGKYVEKNITKAIEHLKQAMNKGSFSAYSMLGQIYLHGNEVQKDEELGLKYLRFAADNTEQESYKALGEYYFFKKNWEEALKYLHISASLGVASSMYYYGIMLLEGLGTLKSCSYALELFKQVSLVGSIKKYSENGFIMYVNQDYEGAFLNFLVSGSLGVENSLLNLAYMYQQDLVPEKFRCSKGKEFCAGWYYHLAYKSTLALHRLGKIVANGNEHFAGNYSEAEKFFKRSENLPESLYELAKMSEYGLGVTQNFTKAGEVLKNLVEMAESGRVDKDAKYPAMLALARVWVKSSPIVQMMQNLTERVVLGVSEWIGSQLL